MKIAYYKINYKIILPQYCTIFSSAWLGKNYSVSLNDLILFILGIFYENRMFN